MSALTAGKITATVILDQKGVIRVTLPLYWNIKSSECLHALS
jgi:hypothetical protein